MAPPEKIKTSRQYTDDELRCFEEYGLAKPPESIPSTSSTSEHEPETFVLTADDVLPEDSLSITDVEEIRKIEEYWKKQIPTPDPPHPIKEVDEQLVSNHEFDRLFTFKETAVRDVVSMI